MRSTLATALLFGAAVGTSACGDDPREDPRDGRPARSAPGQPADGGTLIVAVPAEPGTLFPPLVTGTQGAAIVSTLFDRLAEIGPSLEPYGDQGFSPRLASRWRWSTDSLSIAFTLDSRARWHDGRPVRAADVRFTFATYTNPAVGSEGAPLLSSIDSVTAPDDSTAIFWFRQRTPRQFFDATYHMVVLPAHLLDSIPPARLADAAVARQPVGTGRFRMAAWEPGQRIEVVAVPDHPRGRPHLDRVIWSLSPDVTAATTKLFAGEADFYELIRPENLPQLARTPNVRLVDNPALQYGFLGFNLRDPRGGSAAHPVLGDSLVRRALSMAVDRVQLARNVFDSLGLTALGPAPRALIPDTLAFRAPVHDTVAARALLDAAGWRDADGDGLRERNGRPLAFDLLVPNSSQTRQRYAVLLQEQLRAVGARVTPRILEVNALVAQLDAHTFDAYLGSWQSSPGLVGMPQTWGSTGGGNVGRYANATFDAAVDSALASRDAATARAHWGRAFRQIASDAPAIWLYEQRQPVALHRRVQLPPLRADGWYADLADWWIDPAQRLPRDLVGLGTPP
jgi:peptide/nickel transport system substrate-binding protein